MSERGWTDLGPEYEAYRRARAQRDRRSQPHDRRPRISVELTDRGLRHTVRRQSVTAPAVPPRPGTPFWVAGIVIFSLLTILFIVLFNTLGSPSTAGFSGRTNASRADSRNSCPELLPGWEKYCDMVRYMKCQNAGNTECLREYGVILAPPSSPTARKTTHRAAHASSQDDGVPRSSAHDDP